MATLSGVFFRIKQDSEKLPIHLQLKTDDFVIDPSISENFHHQLEYQVSSIIYLQNFLCQLLKSYVYVSHKCNAIGLTCYRLYIAYGFIMLLIDKNRYNYVSGMLELQYYCCRQLSFQVSN